MGRVRRGKTTHVPPSSEGVVPRKVQAPQAEPAKARNRPARRPAPGHPHRPAPRLPKVALASLTAKLSEPDRAEVGLAEYPSTVASVPVKAARTMEFQGLKLNGGTRAEAEPFWRSTDVSFGRISSAQYDALHREFGGRSQVPYDAAREYDAIDFLPPAVQALVNRDVDAGRPIELKGTAKFRDPELPLREDYLVTMQPNCHGTSWEALRAFQGNSGGRVDLANGDAQIMDGELDERFSRLGHADEIGPRPAFLEQLRPGDVLGFHKAMGGMDLLHTAVYAGGGLFFEKPNTEAGASPETPYRLVTYDQVTPPIMNAHDGLPLSVTAYRPVEALKPLTEAFAFADDLPKKLEGWAQKQGSTLGKPLVAITITGTGGGTLGDGTGAVDQHRLELGPDGRGVLAAPR